MSITLCLSFTIILIGCCYFFYNFYKYYIRKRKLGWLPAVPGWPLIGVALEFGDNSRTLQDLDRLIKRYGKIIYLDLALQSNIITTDYDFVEYILGTQEILAKSPDYKYLHNWLGTGLLTSEGLKWKKRRKMITPAFHFSFLEKFVEIFEHNLEILTLELDNEVNKDSVDVYPFLNRFALDAICETAMGVSVDAQKNKMSRYAKNVREMCRIVMDRVVSATKKFDMLYALCPDFYIERKLVKELHSVTNSVIDSRRRELELKEMNYSEEIDDVGGRKKNTFLDILLQSTIDGKPLSKEDIREEVDTFMFEGQDTISSAASFSLYLLSAHQEVQKRAVEEQKHIFEGDIYRKSTYSDLLEMKYLEMVIKEALRLYPPVPLLGRLTTQDVQYKGTLHDCDRLTKQYGKVLYFDFLLEPNIMSSDYDFVEYILSTQDVLSKSADYKYLHNWLGTGLLTSDGPKWKKRRKMVTPAFHFSILEQFIEVFEQNLEILISKLNNEVNKDDVDIYPFVNLFALDIICETAMGVSINAQRDKKSRYVKNVKEMCRISIERAFSLIKSNEVLYPLCPDYYKEQTIVKELHSVTNSVIDSRRKELVLNGNSRTDDTDGVGQKKKLAFLDILLRSTIDGKPLSKEDIREEVDTFMFEGHDTVSSAISFSLYLLAMHPDVQKRAVDEQKFIFEDDIGRKSTYNDLQAMKYLEIVIKEALRLYPPVPIFARATTQDVKYKGNTIPEGVNIAILSYSILRDPRNFENPEQFDPDRFENSDGTRPYSYIPFSAGPRNCIGQRFAMLEVKSTLSRILRNFELFPPATEHKMVLVSEAVLKSKNGVKIKLSKRNS